MFSNGSFNSISLATVTPSLVDVGEPNFLSRTTLRPLGPNVTFTTFASLFTPRRIAWRLSSPCIICFAFAILPPSNSFPPLPVCCTGMAELISSNLPPRPAPRLPEQFAAFIARPGLLLARRHLRVLNNSQHFVFAQDQIILVVNFDLRAGVFAEQDAIPRLYI